MMSAAGSIPFKRARTWVMFATVLSAAGLGSAPLTAAAAPSAYAACSATQHQACLFGPSGPGGMEMDGNRAVDSSNGFDWATSPFPAALTHLSDLSQTQSDNGMKGGSKWSDQSTWVCDAHKSVGKDDIIDGHLAIRYHPNASGHQYLYLDFTRVAGPGDAYVEFNLSKATSFMTGGCSTLPVRAVGDLLLTFHFSNGGSTKDFSVSKWTAAGYATVATGAEGINWEHAYNDPGNNVTEGQAGIDLSAIQGLGTIGCFDYSKAWMDTRAANQGGTSEMKDFAGPVDFNPGCTVPAPHSSLQKQEKDVTNPDTTQNGGGFTSGPITAQAADVLEYQLTYTNGGTGTANAVTITDTVPSHTTYMSCSDSCSVNASTVTWNLGNLAPGSKSVTFDVLLDSAFTSTATVTNAAAVQTAQEGTHGSNTVAATVNPPAGGQVLGVSTTVGLPAAGAPGPGAPSWLLALLVLAAALLATLVVSASQSRRRRGR